jgi:hypothetical protein
VDYSHIAPSGGCLAILRCQYLGGLLQRVVTDHLSPRFPLENALGPSQVRTSLQLLVCRFQPYAVGHVADD